MDRIRQSIPLLLLTAVFLASAPVLAQHWDPPINQGNMSILVSEATLDGDALVVSDEIGCFTPAGILAGASVLADDGDGAFPVGIAAWGDDQDEQGINGLREGEAISFKVWDHEADEEWDAEVEVVMGEAVYSRDAFALITLAAVREQIADIQLAENAHDFGAVRIGRSVVWSSSIENAGNAVLTIQNIVSSDEAFTSNFENAYEIEAGGSHSLDLTFTPDGAGDFAATITITSDDPDEGEVTIDLVGSGEEAVPADINLSAADRRFGRVIIGQSRNMSLFISNEGDLPLTVSDIAAGDEVFTTTFDGEFVLNTGEQSEVVITFTPTATGVVQSNLAITSNDPDEEVANVALIGEGVEEGEAAAAFIMADEHFYGAVVNGQSAPWRMVVTNIGGSDLHVTDVTTDNEAFSVEFDGNAVRLRPGDYMYVNTSFNPRAEAFFEGNITVFSDDEENSELSLPVAGVGVAANGRYYHAYNTGRNHTVLVTATTLDGNAMGEGAEIAIFTQNGICAGTGVIARDGQAGLAAYGDDESNDVIDGFDNGEALSFKVWDPNARIEAWAAPEFEQGPEVYGDDELTILSLAATVGDPLPDIALSEVDHFYGQVATDASEDWVLTISNRGRGVLTVSDIVADLNEFTTDFDGEFQLELGESRDITVNFAPTDFIEYEGRLTVVSDDPVDSVLYVDMFGLGVDVPREPEIILARANHFFGAIPLNTPAEFVLRVNNRGGGLLRVENVAVDGPNIFTTDWPGQPRNVNAGESFDLTVTFRPAAAGTFQANIVITSDDPNNDVVTFLAEGDGVNEASHFHHRITDGDHSILVAEAILTQPGGIRNPLAPGDEIAVFTPNGLCAGHVMIEEQGEMVGLAAWGDDNNTPVLDGFENGEAFTFIYWDRSTHGEIVAEPTYVRGPEVFQVDGNTEITLLGHTDEVEAQIFVDPPVYQFGGVHVNTAVAHDFRISNTGGSDLTINRIASNLNVYTHNFNNQAVVLEPGESIVVTVTFRPTDDAPYEGNLTVFSDDPDQEQFLFHPCGVGSRENGHYQYMITDRNHSVLVTEFLMGGNRASIGDQVGVFTPDGICAGSGTVEEVGVVGLAAWKDDEDTRYLIEGFMPGEEMTLKVYDVSQDHQYEEFDMEIVQGDMEWDTDAFTVLRISVEGVVIGGADPAAVAVREGEEIDVQFSIANAPGDMAWSFINRGDIPQAAGEVTFTDHGDNTADLHWETSFNSAGEYSLRFLATDGEIAEVVVVPVTIGNVNQPPFVEHPFEDDIITFNEDPQLEGNPGRLVVIRDLRQMFTDPDDNAMIFVLQSIDRAGFTPRVTSVAGVPRFDMIPPANFFGDVTVHIYADDLQRDQQVRNLRSVENDALNADLSNPERTIARDDTGGYTFIVRFNSVNDLPVITNPANANAFVWNIDERDESDLEFRGTDVETAVADLRWEFTRNNVPEAAEFSQANGIAHLHWTPTPNDVGQYQCTVTLNDADGGQDQIVVTINVREVNDPPVYNDDHPIADVNLDEDCERTVIATLNDNHWIDPDQNDRFVYGITSCPAALQGQYNAQTTEVSIQPTANTNGEFDVVVFIKDNNGQAPFNEVRHTIHVVIAPVNDAPTVIAQIAPPNILEDSNLNRVPIVRLSTRFRDVDVGDVIGYTIAEGAPPELGLQINVQTTELSRQLTANYNTHLLENGTAVITIIATDQAGATTELSFNFTVNPDVNDLPNNRPGEPGVAFRLISPANNFRFEGPDSVLRQPIVFEWEEAIQNPWEVDTVRYLFTAVPEGTRDTLKIDTLSLTRYEIPADTVLRRLPRENAINILWTVRAADRAALTGRQFSIPTSSGTFRFICDPLEIKELPHAEMPMNYFISNSYPNPFNARTTLKFGLPIAGDVDVSVWDMHGRKVAGLAAGYHQAGQYELTWTADGMTSGIYLVKMQSGSFVGMQKAILVR